MNTVLFRSRINKILILQKQKENPALDFLLFSSLTIESLIIVVQFYVGYWFVPFTLVFYWIVRLISKLITKQISNIIKLFLCRKQISDLLDFFSKLEFETLENQDDYNKYKNYINDIKDNSYVIRAKKGKTMMGASFHDYYIVELLKKIEEIENYNEIDNITNDDLKTSKLSLYFNLQYLIEFFVQIMIGIIIYYKILIPTFQ